MASLTRICTRGGVTVVSFIPDAMIHSGGSCRAGLLIVVPPGSSATREFQNCNGHPSFRGRNLLAGTVLWSIQRIVGVG